MIRTPIVSWISRSLKMKKNEILELTNNQVYQNLIQKIWLRKICQLKNSMTIWSYKNCENWFRKWFAEPKKGQISRNSQIPEKVNISIIYEIKIRK